MFDKWIFPDNWQVLVVAICTILHQRSAWRLNIIIAGIHRNPMVGPDGAKFIYGHVWVRLSALVRHSWWGTIGLPLLTRMYIRAKDVISVPKDCGLGFQNELQQAAELVKWAAECCRSLQKELWVVTNGTIPEQDLSNLLSVWEQPLLPAFAKMRRCILWLGLPRSENQADHANMVSG